MALFYFRWFCWLKLIFLLVSPLQAADTAHPGEEIRGPLIIEAGEEVVLPSGTVFRAGPEGEGIIVSGKLVAAGTEAKPILFIGPDGWKGIFITGQGIFEGVIIERAAVGIKVNGGTAKVTNSRLVNCSTGLTVTQSGQCKLEKTFFVNNERGATADLRAEMTVTSSFFRDQRVEGLVISQQARGEVSRSTFRENRVAVRLWQKTDSVLRENLFTENQLGVLADQTEDTPTLEKNVIAKNKVGLMFVNSASPKVAENFFGKNETALEVTQISSPRIVGNIFWGNQTALSFLKRAAGRVDQNQFQNNDRAVFCDYSSYPTVSENNFEANKLAIVLGDFQSSDWEFREGNDRSPKTGTSAHSLAGQVINASGNWWGDKVTAEMEHKGADGNISVFEDGRDRTWITYQGYGDKTYRLDSVAYSPWLKKPVPQTGAGLNHLKSLRFPEMPNPLKNNGGENL